MALTREGREARKCLGAREQEAAHRVNHQSHLSPTGVVGRLCTALAVAVAAAVGERGGVPGGCDVPARARVGTFQTHVSD